MNADQVVVGTILTADKASPSDYVHQQGRDLIAFGNALWQLLNAPNLEEALVDTVSRGGDTDTIAAIRWALLGAVHGLNAVTRRRRKAIQNCRTE